MFPQHSQKPFSLHKFPTKHLVGVRKKHWHCTISRRPRTAISKHLKANACIFLHISLRKFLFWRRSKLLSAFIFYLKNNFFKATRFLGHVNILQFFILIEIFGNSTIFQHFETSIYSIINTRKFSRQF